MPTTFTGDFHNLVAASPDKGKKIHISTSSHPGDFCQESRRETRKSILLAHDPILNCNLLFLQAFSTLGKHAGGRRICTTQISAVARSDRRAAMRPVSRAYGSGGWETKDKTHRKCNSAQCGYILTLPHEHKEKREIPAMVWQYGPHHTAYAVIFYSSATQQFYISYPQLSGIACVCEHMLQYRGIWRLIVS